MLEAPVPASVDDLPAIRALHAASWCASYRGILPDHLFGAPIEREMEARWADLGRGRRVLVVRDGADLAGFAAYYPDREGAGFLDNLHVTPGGRGRGTGAALMAGVARDVGARPLWLEVLAGNEPARAVYRRWGGIEGPVFDDRVMGTIVPGLVVRWESALGLLERIAGGHGR